MPADPPGGTTVSLGDDDYVAVNRSLVVTLTGMNDDQPSPRYIVSDSFGLVVNDGGIPPDGGDAKVATISIVVGSTVTGKGAGRAGTVADGSSWPGVPGMPHSDTSLGACLSISPEN